MLNSSHIILVNKNGKLLLQLRDNKPEIASPGHWGLIGGKVNEGEDPLDGLNRELKEEIPGCNVDEIYKLGSIPTETTLINMFVGVIEDSQDFINEKLSEGVKVEFFDFSKIKEMNIVSPIKEFIINNKEGISYVN